jgi:hypothetical protein
MSTTVAIQGWRSGLSIQPRSTAISDSAKLLDKMLFEVRKHQFESYTIRGAAERGLDELEEIRGEASRDSWDGYGGKLVLPETFDNARMFLEALPISAPAPEISADPDGEVSLDWMFGLRKALSVSIGADGRCTFVWMNGQRTYRGTDYLDDDGIPSTIANALLALERDAR